MDLDNLDPYTYSNLIIYIYIYLGLYIIIYIYLGLSPLPLVKIHLSLLRIMGMNALTGSSSGQDDIRQEGGFRSLI